ncbi:MAG: hypothetical protein ACKV2Q_19955, partial [Planctomycetaceae bacterium]
MIAKSTKQREIMGSLVVHGGVKSLGERGGVAKFCLGLRTVKNCSLKLPVIVVLHPRFGFAIRGQSSGGRLP